MAEGAERLSPGPAGDQEISLLLLRRTALSAPQRPRGPTGLTVAYAGEDPYLERRAPPPQPPSPAEQRSEEPPPARGGSPAGPRRGQGLSATAERCLRQALRQHSPRAAAQPLTVSLLPSQCTVPPPPTFAGEASVRAKGADAHSSAAAWNDWRRRQAEQGKEESPGLTGRGLSEDMEALLHEALRESCGMSAVLKDTGRPDPPAAPAGPFIPDAFSMAVISAGQRYREGRRRTRRQSSTGAVQPLRLGAIFLTQSYTHAQGQPSHTPMTRRRTGVSAVGPKRLAGAASRVQCTDWFGGNRAAEDRPVGGRPPLLPPAGLRPPLRSPRLRPASPGSPCPLPAAGRPHRIWVPPQNQLPGNEVCDQVVELFPIAPLPPKEPPRRLGSGGGRHHRWAACDAARTCGFATATLLAGMRRASGGRRGSPPPEPLEA
eukprot:TRINITY_DN51650_c0_g1_i1.p1 TRINITY_DN51650_c0_g1~~TRINITY_DN51650_c0_g1_i1.p1  ORF type:complete len:456 (+),score=107.02 TRINITY_DN51650_c0_g1_i1:73-1368(+)